MAQNIVSRCTSCRRNDPRNPSSKDNW
jgi:hypothetical protein